MLGTASEDQLTEDQEDPFVTPLRGHQAIAVRNAVSAFLDHYARASVVMATGTGKTHVALHVAHRIAPHGNVISSPPTSNCSTRPHKSGIARAAGGCT
ncbi:DEAD/DEAH box helicase family protein [Streptomyces halobius]|uniref:DEAD/DEAH box helicase family protein n=1 Tax=Streptomyces halobius TaxID=2879846 RepID=A0ABY4MIC9_9ACTN|nr:DEAD/DEAH box helicase family protein [Streptomyces halobius]UQA90511.1 DEAD/DEAH box helicase family protein [Streptomyces halobius]UQA97565.1 DEAD/DEAH box helicase family protein [Streptomyces halobius]